MKKLLSVFLSGVMAFGAVSVGAVSVSAKTEPIIYGDVDGNSKVNIKDTTALQKYLAGITTETDKTLSDVNNDGVVNVTDAKQIQQYATNDVDRFVAEKDNDWRSSSIGYEIFIRTFYDSDGDGCGDFRGVAEKVDYLKSLNVGVVWLMPFNKSSSYHGYDVKDYLDVNEDYGTMEDLEYMMDTLHNNGIKVIMDLVVNHTSSGHPWFVESQKSTDNPYFDYYVWRQQRPSPTGWSYKFSCQNWFYSCFNSNMPDLNYSNKKVWDEVDSIAEFWLNKGVDGFRLDAAMHIDDTVDSSGKHVDEKEDSVTHEWWQHFESKVKSINPDAFCIGEVWPETNMVETQARFFADLDSDFDFSNMSEFKNFAIGTDVKFGRLFSSYEERIKNYASKTPDVPKVTMNSVMLANHDTNRMGYNVKTSSKLNDETRNYEDRLKLVASAQMTVPGMPWIYYGDEIGMYGGGSSGSDDVYRREPMDWYTSVDGTGATKMNAIKNWGTPKYTKADDGVSVQEQNGVEGSILEHYKKLTEIRNKYKIFYTGEIALKAYINKAPGYTITDDLRDYSMFVIHNNKLVDYTYTADCDFTDVLSGKSYKKGDTVTLSQLSSMIIPYTDTVPLV